MTNGNVIEKGVHVYYIEMRDLSNKRKKLTSLEIRDVLDSIGSLEFSMNKEKSMFRKLWDTWFGADVNGRSKESKVHSDSSRIFNGLRVRDEKNLPHMMKSKSIMEKLFSIKPKDAHIVERSLGVFYLLNKIQNGCILFLLVNRFGMQITRIQDYVRNIFPNLRLYWTVLADKNKLKETLDELNEMRAIIIDNIPIMPAVNEGLGTYNDRISHPEDHSVVFTANRIDIQFKEHTDDKMRVFKDFVSKFMGKKEITDQDANNFIDKNNAKLKGVLIGKRRQETIDLTRNLFAFTYTIEDSFVIDDFYNFCDERFTTPEIQEKIISLCSGLGVEISNIYDGE